MDGRISRTRALSFIMYYIMELFFADLISAVRRSSAKTAKIGPLTNFPQCGNILGQFYFRIDLLKCHLDTRSVYTLQQTVHFISPTICSAYINLYHCNTKPEKPMTMLYCKAALKTGSMRCVNSRNAQIYYKNVSTTRRKNATQGAQG